MKEKQNRLNFEPQLNKIKSICSSWSNRNLSLKGKVTVIYALLISLLQYQCAYNNIIQDIPNGGIKLADLQTRVLTCHISWIKYLWFNHDSLSARILSEITGTNDLSLTLLAKCKQSVKFKKDFKNLKQLLQTWEQFHLIAPSTEKEIQEEFLWNNKFVIIERATIYWSKWSKAGITFVNDIIPDTLPTFLSHTKITQKYQVNCTFLQALQIRSALPGDWRKQITHHSQPFFLPKLYIQFPSSQQKHFLDKTSKLIYQAILPQKNQPRTSQDKWLRSLHPNQPQHALNWESIYKMPYHSPRETKLQSFQLKILYRIILCNLFLKNIRICLDDICSYRDGIDSIEHFLYDCDKVQLLWSNFCSWTLRELNLDINVLPEHFFLGLPPLCLCTLSVRVSAVRIMPSLSKN